MPRELSWIEIETGVDDLLEKEAIGCLLVL
jgi:hypothetical protein